MGTKKSNDLSGEIAENALGPKSVTTDGITTTAHSLREQIEADKYLRTRSAKRRFKIQRFRPGGPT